MEQIFVKVDPESENDLNDHLFPIEHVKVREINVHLACYANHRCHSYVVLFSFL